MSSQILASILLEMMQHARWIAQTALVFFFISGECSLFNFGEASILTAELAAIKFEIRATQDRNLQKIVILIDRLGACKCMVSQTPTQLPT